MAASFRNTEEIKGIVGCDLMTISPSLLEKLSKEQESISPVLTPEKGTFDAADQWQFSLRI